MSAGLNASMSRGLPFFFTGASRKTLDRHKMAHSLSVGHMLYWVLVLRASFSAFQVFFSCSGLWDNALTGTIPPQISALTKLTYLYAPKWHIHWVCVTCFIECWSCAPLSQPFNLFSLQEPRVQPTDWDNPSADIWAGQAAIPVGPHFFFN